MLFASAADAVSWTGRAAAAFPGGIQDVSFTGNFQPRRARPVLAAARTGAESVSSKWASKARMGVQNGVRLRFIFGSFWVRFARALVCFQ